MPPRLYQICGWFIPWLAIASAVVLITGWGWGFGFAPADYQQGQSYRIIYLHVPAAIWSMGIYASMAVAAFIGLVWQMKMATLAVAAVSRAAAFVRGRDYVIPEDVADIFRDTVAHRLVLTPGCDGTQQDPLGEVLHMVHPPRLR